MSTLLIDQLKPGQPIDQPITISRDGSIAHIRPWIYKHGFLLDGQFKVTVLQGSTELFSSTIDYTEINAITTDAYAHGQIRFDFDNAVIHVEESATITDYILRFEMINHTFNASNYISLCRRYEQKTYPTTGGEPPNDYVEPFGFEIFDYKVGR